MKHKLDYLSLMDAAHLARCSKELIYRVVNDDKLDCYTLQFGAKEVFVFKEQDVLTFSQTIKRRGTGSAT